MEGGSQQIVKQAAIQADYPRQIQVQITSEISHPMHERRFAVRQVDWMRVQRQINELPAVPPTLAVWYSVFFGSGLAALISLPPLFYAKEISSWVLPAEIILCVGSFVLGAGLRTLEKIFLKERKRGADEILRDMADIIEPFQKPESAELRLP